MVPPSRLLPVGRMYGTAPYAGWWADFWPWAIVEGHTGGTVRLPSGETVSADEAHQRLCESGVLTAEDCLRSPSQEAEYWADLPEGWWETALESAGGYEFRHEVVGTRSPTDPKPEIDWKRLAFVGVSATVLLFILGKK